MTTFKRVKKCIVECAGVDDSIVVSEASLADDIGLDSLDQVDLAIELEGEFDIDISDELIESAFTVGDIVKAVEGLLEAKS